MKRKDERVHGTTHEVVKERFRREQPHLTGLPSQVFDTSYRVYRRVLKDCTVRFEGNSYVVPHTLVGKEVLLRVKGATMRIFRDNELVVIYEVVKGKGELVQEKRFYDALKKDRIMNARKYGNNGKRKKGRAKNTISPLKPLYEMDVEVRSVAIYDQAIGGL